jgi:AcrR family transcriptional regulator
MASARPRVSQVERRARTRQRLLDAARVVFGERGFGAATLEEVARVAGLTRGALYYNFSGGKEELFLALLDERIAQRAATLRQTFVEQPSSMPLETIRAARGASRDALASVVENRDWWMLFFEFALHAGRDQRFAAQFAAREQDMRDALADAIRARAGGLDDLPVSAGELATGINALANGLVLDSLVDAQTFSPELFGTLVGLLVRGVIAAAADQTSAAGATG